MQTEVIYSMIGQLIRAVRLKADISQEQLAERVGLTRTTITYIETGRQRVQIHTLYEIAEALGVSLSAFLPNRIPGEKFRCDICRGDFSNIYKASGINMLTTLYVKNGNARLDSTDSDNFLAVCPNCSQMKKIEAAKSNKDPIPKIPKSVKMGKGSNKKIGTARSKV